MGWEGPITHRQFLTWQAWDAMEWNRPSRTDHYLMGVECEVRRVLSKKPNDIQPEHFKMKFNSGAQKPVRSEAYKQQISDVSKQIWLSRMTMQPVEYQVGFHTTIEEALTKVGGS